MIIESIYVENFRCIKKEQLDCDALTVIIGRNGSGKSSFLKSIDIFYDISAPITEEDFFNRDTNQEIVIRVTYIKLKEPELQEFKTYCRDGKLIVTKKINSQDGRFIQKYYVAAMQIPEFAEIRALTSKREKTTRFYELANSGKFPGLKGNVRKADKVEELMISYEAEHPRYKEPIAREEQFFGPKILEVANLINTLNLCLSQQLGKQKKKFRIRKGQAYSSCLIFLYIDR